MINKQKKPQQPRGGGKDGGVHTYESLLRVHCHCEGVQVCVLVCLEINSAASLFLLNVTDRSTQPGSEESLFV